LAHAEQYLCLLKQKMLGSSVFKNFVSRRKKIIIILLVAGLCFEAFRSLHSTDLDLTSKQSNCFCDKDHARRYNATNNTQTSATGNATLKFENDVVVFNKSCDNVPEKLEIRTPAPLPVNYVDFKLILPFIEPNLDPQKRKLYIVVVVNSAAKGENHRTLRQAIRETWGSTTKSQTGHGNTTHPWKLFFSLGIADNPTDHEANLKEAREHNDIIIGNFTASYRNLVIKTFMAHFWAVTKLSCDYVLKTDDDVYVRVPGLISWLVKSGSPKQFFGGMVALRYRIIRDPASDLYISEDQYPGIYWPLWCHGSYHVLSSDIIPRYIIYTYKRKPFQTDDAYLGVAALDLGIKVIQIPGFTIEDAHPRKFRSDKEMNESLAIGHKIAPDQMKTFHEYYKRYSLT